MKDYDAEYMEPALIAAVITYPDTYPEVAAIVKSTDFALPSAMMTWIAIGEQWGQVDKCDFLGTIYLSLTTAEAKQWLMRITSDMIPFAAMAKVYAERIASAAKCRRIAVDLAAIAAKAKSNGNNPESLLYDISELYRQEAGNADEDVSISAGMQRFRQIQAENKDRGFIGHSTGFDSFSRDYLLYQPGHLWVIGAWTSTGKTAYMIEAVSRFLKWHKDGRVAVFSTEMTEEQNIARILANKTGVNAKVILSGCMLEKHAQMVDEQAWWLEGCNLHIYSKIRSIEELIAECRKLKMSGGIDLVWIDFIQNLTKRGARDQYTMMSEIARDLQALALELRCTVLCLSQLPNHAGREDTGILEYKGAGEIAAACDIGVLMKRAQEDKSQILFDVRKNRHGKCAKYRMQFADGYTRINDLGQVAERWPPT